jgi:recombination protein U
MPSNSGKRFEEDIKKSLPEWCWVYRLRDSAGTWQGGDNTRFTSSNICDFIVMARDLLLLLELKSHTGTNFPISCIRKNQIEDMSKVSHKKIKPYFLINFKDIQSTYAVEASSLKDFIENTSRKSIPIKWCIEHGTEIPSEKKRVRYRYDLGPILIDKL